MNEMQNAVVKMYDNYSKNTYEFLLQRSYAGNNNLLEK